MGDPRNGASRDPHIGEAGTGEAGTSAENTSSSDTHRSQPSEREAMTQPLMELSVWLSENPKALRKNLKAVRRGAKIDPGVYYNSGLTMIERLYRPQHVALGHKMFRISPDPAAPVDEIRRKVLEGKR